MVSQPLLAKHRGQLVLTLTALFLTLILGALLVNARHLSLHALSHVTRVCVTASYGPTSTRKALPKARSIACN